MPGIDLQKLYSDPTFRSWSRDHQTAVLRELGYDPGQAGGAEAGMRAAGPDDAESLWSKAKTAISSALFGDPERARAAEAGIGLAPGAREMITGPLQPGLMAYGASALMNALPMAGSGIRAAVPAALRYAGVTGAGATGATIGGTVGAKVGQEVGMPTAGAVVGTVLGGALGGRLAGGAATVPGAVAAAEAPAAEAGLDVKRAIEAARAAKLAEQAASDAPIRVANIAAREAKALAAKTVQTAAKSAPAMEEAAAEGAVNVVKNVSEASARTREMWKAVNDLVKSGQKIPSDGKKIWFKLENGKPVKLITSGQAGHLAEDQKSWIANMWGK